MFATQNLFSVGVVLGGLLLGAADASAQDQVPVVKQEFGKQEEVKEVIWKASASAGFSISTGNASVMTLSGGATASRNDGANPELHTAGQWLTMGVDRSLGFTLRTKCTNQVSAAAYWYIEKMTADALQ